MRTLLVAALACLVTTGQAGAADSEASTILIVQPGEGGPVTDLVPFEALVGGEEIETATDFGFFQKSEDGYAIRAVRTRIGITGLRASDCVGGMAPTPLPDLFEGAYVCGDETPVGVSYQPGKGLFRPNMIDPNGVWEEETFFVSKIMSMKMLPVRGVGLPGSALLPLSEKAPETLDGLMGRVAPPRVQASGACGNDIAVFFPLAALPACADADLFEE